ncbi:MAG: MarR family transcriptional regulator [Bacteroidetes bacterium]|nr:MarR family transcriptional regulator [Bacteroidota bacterium]
MSININLAKEMAHLTCDLARTCSEKENYFASMFNLTPAEFRCLRLFEDRNSMTIKELCRLMELTPGRITHILTSLEAKNFITRASDKQDKRNIIVTLTNKSLPFIKNVSDSHVKIHKEILEKIPQDKRDDVISALSEVLKALQEWNKKK